MPLVPADQTSFTSNASIASFASDLLSAPLHIVREKWRRAHRGVPLPLGLPRDLMVRGITWHEQCTRYGGLALATERVLDKMARQLEVAGTLEIERSVRPKTGTRILREWRDKTYVVEVADDGFVHDGAKYASLSHVARAITGTRWSGPRFFGLKHADPVSGEGDR